MIWVEKHSAKTFTEIRGQEAALEKIHSFLNDFGKPKSKKAMLLHGPPGTGKTTLAYITANMLQSEIFELNASNLRDRTRLEESLKPAIQQKSLFQKTKIVLIDEVDGLSGTDAGGLPVVLELIKESQIPIVITANDVWDKKFSELRKNTELIQLKEVSYRTIQDILIDILRKEKKFINREMLTTIAVKAKGDVRAAINDVQLIANAQFSEVAELPNERDKEKDIFQVLRYIFKGLPKEDMLEQFDDVDMSIDEIFLWIEENLPKEYEGKELAEAFERLSKADVFRGRIYRQQHWRFLLYENILLSYGISAAKKGTKTGFTSYQKPSRILKIWMTNQQIAKKKTIAEKFASLTHINKKRALRDFSVYHHFINTPEIRKELKLSEEEMLYLENYERK